MTALPRAAVVPVMGRIAAGVPISAIQDHTPQHHGAARDAGRGRAFRARGQGRFDDQCRHLRRRHRAHPQGRHRHQWRHRRGLVDNEEATLKRIRRKGDSIALEAANPSYETRIFGPDRVQCPGPARRADPEVLKRNLASRRGLGRGSRMTRLHSRQDALPPLRRFELAGRLLDRERRLEQRLLVERLADELQAQRQARLRSGPPAPRCPAGPPC